MNLTPDQLTTLIINLLPFGIALAAYLYKLATQRLPEQQRQALEQFSRIAVQKIEQVYPAAGAQNKKQLAKMALSDLFKAFKLPVPNDAALDAALESAVLLLKQTSQPAAVPPPPVAVNDDDNPLALGVEHA